ncbi:MAG: uroporphyrinogen-III synthase [Gammaproteobacteria bacterium]|nr:uroporphyrinogen-III synthase [Gammaproteobacteria bacterium]
MTERPLQGVGVLVTRPRSQANDLVAAIEAEGGYALRFPVLEIAPRDTLEIERAAAALPAPDIAIFVSPNAVRHGLAYAGEARVAAIGPSTAAAISDAGLQADIVPADGFDSESLLRHEALLHVEGKEVRIIRGADGRELLADTLRARGAEVRYLGVYDREAATPSDAEIAHLEATWRKGDLHAITIMSVETLTGLTALLPDWCERQLATVPLVTPAARVIKEALDRYPDARPILASGPQSKEMVQAIIAIHRTDPGIAP